MKIELDTQNPDQYRINSYDTGSVAINGNMYHASVIVSPDSLVDSWPPQVFTDLSVEHFEPILLLKPEIVLLGTGERNRFPADEIIAPLLSRQIGLEIMDTGAACRSYNFLMAEGRRVVAALLMIR